MKLLSPSALLLLGSPFAAVAFGCTSRAKYEAFHPVVAEKAGKNTAEDFGGAEQSLCLDSEKIGDARIWPAGVSRRDGITTIRVGVEIVNASDVPLSLVVPTLGLDILTQQGGVRQPVAGTALGNATVEPGRASNIMLQFELPEEIKPNEVAAYRLRWQIETQGQRLSQETPFAQDRKARYGYAPYDSPYPQFEPADPRRWPGVQPFR